MQVKIYTTPWCPFCIRAKSLLNKKGVNYEEIDVSEDPALRRTMSELAGGRTTVPQIFFDGKPIGGCDDLYALENAGDLDGMLNPYA